VATSYLTPGVYVEEVASSSATLTAGATAVAAFIGFTEKAPTDDKSDPRGVKPRMVTSWTQFESLYGGFIDNAMLPHSVYGYFNNGGSIAYIVRIENTTPSGKPAALALTAGNKKLGPAVTFTTVAPDDAVTVTIVKDPEPEDVDPKAPATAPTYSVEVNKAGQDAEKYPNVTIADIGTKMAASTLVKVDVAAFAAGLDPALQTLTPGQYPVKLEKGTTISSIPAKEFAGSESARTGINGLAIKEDVTMVIVPDLITAAKLDNGEPDLVMWKTVQLALVNHCEGHGNRMAILDTPPGLSPQKVKEWNEDAGYSSAYAALYYPWIQVTNPAGTKAQGNTEIMVPPSGHMAGIWARNDNERGVWKAPANEVVRGALKVETDINAAEQGTLNPVGINCIRGFGTRGIRVWGGRTLSSNTDWTYINVRRLFNMIETSIMTGTQYAVFEPNDQKLWEGLKRTVGGFLRGLWREGALFGASAEQAFYVKCDDETNPPESIDQGKVVVEVGIAPVKPAEFVIFRIAQIKGESA
jgi:uncharacterized protein